VSDHINEVETRKSETTATRSATQHSCLCKFEVEVPGVGEGAEVALVGSHHFLGEWEESRALPMFRTHGNFFSVSMHLPGGTNMEYRYLVKSEPAWEGGASRFLRVAGHLTVTRDFLWHPSPPHGSVVAPPLTAEAQEGQEMHGGARGAEGPTRMCTFRLEQIGDHEEFKVGVSGDTPALGMGDVDRCLPMKRQMDTEPGRAVYTACAELYAGTDVRYRYVLLREPRWEQRQKNRAIVRPAPEAQAMAQRRDNVRLVRRVLDVVGVGAEEEDSAKLSLGLSMSVTATDDKTQLEAVGHDAFLEPLDLSLAGTCMVKIDVEVHGISKHHRVWVCGEARELGAWSDSQVCACALCVSAGMLPCVSACLLACVSACVRAHGTALGADRGWSSSGIRRTRRAATRRQVVRHCPATAGGQAWCACLQDESLLTSTGWEARAAASRTVPGSLASIAKCQRRRRAGAPSSTGWPRPCSPCSNLNSITHVCKPRPREPRRLSR